MQIRASHLSMQHCQIALYLTSNKKPQSWQWITHRKVIQINMPRTFPINAYYFSMIIYSTLSSSKASSSEGKSWSPYLWGILYLAQLPLFRLVHCPEQGSLVIPRRYQTDPRAFALDPVHRAVFPIAVWLTPSLLSNLDSVKPLLSILWSHSFQERELTSEFKRENFMEKLLAKYGDLWTRQLEVGQWEHEGIRSLSCRKQLPSLGDMRKQLQRLQLRSWDASLQSSGGWAPLGGLSELGGSDHGLRH